MKRRIEPDGYYYSAKNVVEAVRVAEQFKEEGQFDLFRGQLQDFPVGPSIFRPNVNVQTESEKLDRFINWVHDIPELASLHNNIDAITAVAQHYGLKTTFLDFTTNPKVAGFFSAHGSLPLEGTVLQSCIICMNRHHFENLWKDINEHSMEKTGQELVNIRELPIKNLWRLESQAGIFVDCHVDDTLFEMFSGMYRIVFPYTGPYSKITQETIYPTRKSHLEILLDQYFSHEGTLVAKSKMKELFDEAIYSSVPYFGQPSAFLARELPPYDQSWNQGDLINWVAEPEERIEETRTKKTLRLRFRSNETPVTASLRFAKQIMGHLKRDLLLRSRHLNFTIVNEDGSTFTVDDEDVELLDDDTYVQIDCSQIATVIWDGMRRLPFSDDQVASAIGNYVAMAFLDRSGHYLFGSHIGVEFHATGLRNRCNASNTGILRAIRPDIRDFISQKSWNDISKSRHELSYELLSILVETRRLFNFPEFVDFFAKEIIPGQALFRLHGNRFLFSPAQIKIFGIS